MKLSYHTGLPPALKRLGFDGPFTLRIAHAFGQSVQTMRVLLKKQDIASGEDLVAPGLFALSCEAVEAALQKAYDDGHDVWADVPEPSLAEDLANVAKHAAFGVNIVR